MIDLLSIIYNIGFVITLFIAIVCLKIAVYEESKNPNNEWFLNIMFALVVAVVWPLSLGIFCIYMLNVMLNKLAIYIYNRKEK